MRRNAMEKPVFFDKLFFQSDNSRRYLAHGHVFRIEVAKFAICEKQPSGGGDGSVSILMFEGSTLFLRRRIHWKIQKNWKLDAYLRLCLSQSSVFYSGEDLNWFPPSSIHTNEDHAQSKVTILHRRQVEAKAPEWCGRRQSGSLQFTNQPSLCLINYGLTKARSPSKPSCSCSLRDKEECGSHPIERSLCLDTREESFCISISASHG
ncbi:hypothetical protein D5086_019201 [Populus alba]|uniref:Uncharacterized protein n=1 Tax=Populus alba TaxID=43335 RepID=A0ACC4BH71_POPAL